MAVDAALDLFHKAGSYIAKSAKYKNMQGILAIQKLTSATYGYYGLFGTQQVNLEYGSMFPTEKCKV